MEPAQRRRLEVRAHEGVRALIQLLGDNPDRRDLVETPERMITALGVLAARPNPPGQASAVLRAAAAKVGPVDGASDGASDSCAGPVTFTAICQDHLFPFAGVAHVGHHRTDGYRAVDPWRLDWLVGLYATGPTSPIRIAQQVVLAIKCHVGGAGAGCVVRVTRRCPVLHEVDDPEDAAGWGSYTADELTEFGRRTRDGT
jgi:GTP cyclohydrolase IA